MTVEERIAAAARRKTEGNEYFKEKRLEEAMQQYEMVRCLHTFGLLMFLTYQEALISVVFLSQAIAYMGDDFMFQLFGKYRDMALAVKNPCHLNTAACLIKLKRFDEAIVQCSIVCHSSFFKMNFRPPLWFVYSTVSFSPSLLSFLKKKGGGGD